LGLLYRNGYDTVITTQSEPDEMHRYKTLLKCLMFGCWMGNAVSAGKSADSANDEQRESEHSATISRNLYPKTQWPATILKGH
jgi:hypothetical protein